MKGIAKTSISITVCEHEWKTFINNDGVICSICCKTYRDQGPVVPLWVFLLTCLLWGASVGYLTAT